MRLRKQSGQLLVEFVIGLSLWGVVFAMSANLLKLSLLRLKMNQAARLGAMLLSTSLVPESVVKSEVENYLRTIQGSGPQDPHVSMGRFTETPASRFYQLVFVRIEALFFGWKLDERVVIQKEVSET